MTVCLRSVYTVTCYIDLIVIMVYGIGVNESARLILHMAMGGCVILRIYDMTMVNSCLNATWLVGK